MELPFESAVLEALGRCGVVVSESLTLGVAVSGGADSVSLLSALHSLQKQKKTEGISFLLKAVTVDHNMRPPEQSARDAIFVENYCEILGVPCRRFTVPEGEIFSYAKKMKVGEEAAARVFRYKAFDTFISQENVDFLCLAHNKNDQVETLTMRFLQGGDVKSLSGIPCARGKIIRPLLNVSRSEILSYLSQNKIPFTTDETNSDMNYLRNRIRGTLIPALKEISPGCENAILGMKEKMLLDWDFIEGAVNEAKKNLGWKKDSQKGSLCFLSEPYRTLHPSLRMRLLFSAANEVLSEDTSHCVRIPYEFIKRTDSALCFSEKENVTHEGFGLLFSCEGERIFVRDKKKAAVATERVFFAIVQGEGNTVLPDFVLFSRSVADGIELSSSGESGEGIFVPSLTFPFIIRSAQTADTVIDSALKERSVLKILEGWKCSGERSRIPLVQSLSEPSCPVKAIWGSLYGFKNWIVRAK